MDGWTDEEIEAATVATDDAEEVHYLDNGLVVRQEGETWKRVGRWDPPAAFTRAEEDEAEPEPKPRGPKGERANGRAKRAGELVVIPLDDELAMALGANGYGEDATKYNPYHDSRGRFTTGGGATSVTLHQYSAQQKQRIREATGVTFLEVNDTPFGEKLAETQAWLEGPGKGVIRQGMVDQIKSLGGQLRPGVVAPSLNIGGKWLSPAISAKYGGSGYGGAFAAGDQIRKLEPGWIISVREPSVYRAGPRVSLDVTYTSAWSSVSAVEGNAKIFGPLRRHIAPLRGQEQNEAVRHIQRALTASLYGWQPKLATKAVKADESADDDDVTLLIGVILSERPDLAGEQARRAFALAAETYDQLIGEQPQSEEVPVA